MHSVLESSKSNSTLPERKKLKVPDLGDPDTVKGQVGQYLTFPRKYTKLDFPYLKQLNSIILSQKADFSSFQTMKVQCVNLNVLTHPTKKLQ